MVRPGFLGEAISLLPIRSDRTALDFLTLGALVHRLDPGVVPFRQARSAEIHVSGGEYNVAANLADCFRLRAGVCTAMVDYGIGELVQSRVRETGVTPFYKWFAHDGVRGPNIATVYSDRGQGVRPPVVFYNRANEAAALLKPGDFDWKAIFAAGVRWFHSGGIFAALSPATADLIVEAMQAAKAAGAVTSFDLNYRAKLWANGGVARAQEVFGRIVPHVDVLFGDVQQGLGLAGPDAVPAKYPNVKLVATTQRVEHSANRHDWAAALWLNGQQFVTPTMSLDVLDRIGSGDGFAAGLIYGLLAGRSPEDSLRLGWAHGALVTSYPGDVSMARLEEVEALAAGRVAKVQR